MNQQEMETVISSIDQSNWIRRRLSQKDQIAEALQVVELVVRDRTELAATAIDPQLLESFEQRVSIWTHASNRALLSKKVKHPARIEWKNTMPKQRLFRDELLETIAYAVRANAESVARVTSAIKGYGHFDRCLDFTVLGALIGQYREELRAINFDFDIETECARRYEYLSHLCSTMRMNPIYVQEMATYEKQAFTYMMIALQEIRNAGLYAFRHDPKKREQYKSGYYKVISKQRWSEKPNSHEEV